MGQRVSRRAPAKAIAKAAALALVASLAPAGISAPDDAASANPNVNCSIYASGGTATAIEIAGLTYCRHAFTTVGSSSFTILDSRITVVDYLVVAGGGGGGARDVGGGGGAGGVVTNFRPGGTNTQGFAVDTATPVTVVVGGGGNGSTDATTNTSGSGGQGSSGANSQLGTLPAAAGGGGGGNYAARGRDGGSGGGNGGYAPVSTAASSAIPSGQGNPGGTQVSGSNAGGGGGGFSAAGENGAATRAGNGGNGGDFSSFLGDDIGDAGWFAGGGGGAQHRNEYFKGRSGGDGGRGGGGGQPVSATSSGANGTNGTANTGGGGGAATANGGDTPNGRGGNGGSGIVVIRYALPPASSGICDGSSSQDGISVTAGHGSIFYIDTSVGQEIDASYLAYSVASSNARSGLWVELASFTGGVVSLAGPSQALHPLDPITAAGSQTAFAMVKARGATKIAQSHQVRVYDKKPVSSSIRPLYACSFSFVEVRETIKANSNKIDSITATSEIKLGGELVITVLGDTGTIGNGNAVDGRVVWLSPAARSDWPSASMRLENTTISFFSDSNRTTALSTHNNVLRISSKSSPVLNNASRQYYRAVYTFRVVNAATTDIPIIPVAMISSGAQVKNTSLKSVTDNKTTINLAAPKVDVNLTKDVNTTTAVNSDGTTTVEYTVKMKNNGSSAVSIDEVIDVPDAQLSYVPGTSKLSGNSIADPFVLATGELNYSGPISVAAGQEVTISYQMRAVTCAPGGQFSFTNTASARIGSVVVGSSTKTRSLVNLNGDCGVEEATKTVEEVALDPEVFTGTATNTTQTSATVSGFVDSNGQSGLPVSFRYSLNSDLSSSVSVASGTTSDSDSPVAYSAELTNLQAGKTYYYRAEVAISGQKVFSGDTLTFSTDPIPTPPSVQTTAAIGVTTNSATLTGRVEANQVEGGLKVSFEWEKSTSCQANGSGLAESGFASGFLQTENATNDGFEDSIYAGQSEAAVDFPVALLAAGENYCFRVIGHQGASYQTKIIGDWLSFTATSKTPQKIVWDTRMDVLVAGGSTTISANSLENDNSLTGLSVSYQSVDETICTVDQFGLVTAIAVRGVCAITATQEGDSLFEPAIPATLAIEISTPSITTTSVTGGTYRSASSYSQLLSAEGGAGNYQDWKLVSGDRLPAGLSLDPETGLISGIPTEAGIFEFRVTTTSGGIVTDPVTISLVIAKAPAVITASSLSLEFGAPNPLITASYSGFLATDSSANSVITAPVCVSDYTVSSDAGTIATSSCKNAWSDNYSFSYVNGTVTVTKKTITLKALDATKQNIVDAGGNIQASPDPQFSFTFSPALPGGQSLQDVLQGSLTLTRASGETPGDYTITPNATAKSPGNYQLAFETGTLTIQTPKYVPEIEIDASSLSLVYGQTLAGRLNPSATSTVGRVAGSFGFENATGSTLNFSDMLPAGVHTIVVIFEASDKDNFIGLVQKSVTITVAPAPLTITAASYSKRLGSLDPAFSWSMANRVGGESEAEFGNITLSRASGQTVGAWAITSSGGSHNNYTLNHVPGALYIYDLVIETEPASGIVQSRTINFECDGLAPGTKVSATLLDTQQTLVNTTADSGGKCQFDADVPSEIEFGILTMELSGVTPNSDQVSVNKIFTLFREGAVLPPGGGGGAAKQLVTDGDSESSGARETKVTNPSAAAAPVVSGGGKASSGQDTVAGNNDEDTGSNLDSVEAVGTNQLDSSGCAFPWWPILLILLVFLIGQIVNARVSASWLTRQLLAASLLPPTLIAVIVGISCQTLFVAIVGLLLGIVLAIYAWLIPKRNRSPK